MTDYIVNQTKQLENGVWVIAKGDQQWDDELNYDLQKLDDLIGTVNALPTSGKLEIVQGSQKLGEFNPNSGENSRIEIPEQSDLEDLTITQGGKTLGFYRGNAKTIDIPVPKEPETLTIKQSGVVLGTYSGEAAEIIIPKQADPVKLTVKQGSNVLGTYVPNETSDVVISIPVPPDQTVIEPLVITQNGEEIGTYDGTDKTIDIPVPNVQIGKLTVKQGLMTLGEYTGSELQIDIPENQVTQTLTLKQGETELGTYSGSETEINIPEQKIGTLTLIKGSVTLGTFKSSESDLIEIPENKTLTIIQNGTEIGTYSGLYDVELNLTDTKPKTLTLKQGSSVLGTYDGSETTINIPASGSSGFVPEYDTETYVPIFVNLSSDVEIISQSREYLNANPDLETDDSDYFQELSEKAEAEEEVIESLQTSNFSVVFSSPQIETGDVSESITYQYLDSNYETQEKTEDFSGKSLIIACSQDNISDSYGNGLKYKINGVVSDISKTVKGTFGSGSGYSDKNKFWCNIKIVVSTDWSGLKITAGLNILKSEDDLTEKTFRTMKTVFLED